MNVDAGRDLLGVVALEVVHEAGAELDVLEAARHLAGGVGDDLAVLTRDDAGEFVAARRDDLAELEHDGGTLRQARVAPAGQRGAGGRDGRVEFAGRRERHPSGDLAGGGVEHVALATRFPCDPCSVDPVPDLRDVCHVSAPFLVVSTL